MEFYKWKEGGDINLKKKPENKRDIWLLIIIITGGSGVVEIEVKRCGRKKEKKKL